jgi:hypothetical protein
MIQGATLSAHASPASGFYERVGLLLARIDCRLAISGRQREEIGRLRYAACMRQRAVSQHSFPRFSDRYDWAGNVYLFGLYIDDELASSIRLHIASNEQPRFPSLDVFADVLQSKLDMGQVIVDCTRLVADEHHSRRCPELPYATIRFCMLAAEHFNADYLVTAASQPHQAFYRRAFNYRPLSEPRFHPDLAIPVRLMTLDYRSAADGLHKRYPFFRSTSAERVKLFGHSKRSLGAS